MSSTVYSKILVAPSAYKGTLSALEVARAIGVGIAASGLDAVVVTAPVADGGDGTIEAIQTANGGTLHELIVAGAVGQEVRAHWLELPSLERERSTRRAVVELACASGLGMLDPTSLHPLHAHTLGTGQVLLHCLEKGFRDIFVCVGGSASTDGGSGLLRALGALWLDGQGLELGLGGGALAEIAACDLAKLERWRDVSITVATDVRSPLTGELGAAYIFAPQKGAAPEDVLTLDHALSKFADVLEAATDRFVRNLPGAGAAGGTAFGLACALNARIVPGFDWVADLTDLEAKIAASDLVITGEGCLDEQSLVGKATGELAALCQHYGTPLWVVPGRSAQSTNWLDYGIERVVPVSGGPEANNSEPADADAIARTVAALFA